MPTPNPAKEQTKAMIQKASQTQAALSLAPEVIASLVLNGDLSKLNPQQKVAYYNALCERVGLDPSTQPFKLLRLNGKEVMYADKGATQQLSERNHISHDVTAKETVSDVYVVTVKASLPTGRFTVELGAVSIAGLKGEALANAMMKAMTKAKRRAVLALMGLGMIDDSEVESIPGAERLPAPVVDQELADKKPVEQPKGNPNAPDLKPEKAEPAPTVEQKQSQYVTSAMGALRALKAKDDRTAAAAWGHAFVAKRDSGEITQGQYNELTALYRELFPKNPTTGDQQALPLKAEQAAETKTAEPAKKARAKKNDDPRFVIENLVGQIKAVDKLSSCFSLKSTISKSKLPEEEKKELLAQLNDKMTAMKKGALPQ